MSRFDAATAVEAMEYDFTKYGGSVGEIPEPTTGQMNDFMVGMRRLLAEYRSQMPTQDDDDEKDPRDMSSEELGQMMDSLEDNMALAAEFNEKSILLTAEFCSHQPSTDELSKLPMRVMRAFSKWLMQQINPKEEEEKGTIRALPAPQDRRPATKGSRKARR